MASRGKTKYQKPVEFCILCKKDAKGNLWMCDVCKQCFCVACRYSFKLPLLPISLSTTAPLCPGLQTRRPDSVEWTRVCCHGKLTMAK